MSSIIIAGRFQQQSEVEDTVDELLRAGFARENISAFYVNPAGQHDAYPIGGDRMQSPGAEESGKGVAAGAAVGAAAGVAATPFLGPLGAVTGGLLGAHVGGLVGSMSQMQEKDDSGAPLSAQDPQAQRQAGMLVAVAVADDAQEDQAIHVLRAAGAANLERAQGTIAGGDWNDFNPLDTPELIGNPPAPREGGASRRP
ncbi:MAG TPA: hypothetical protein VJ652_15930 [Noviherbaspirillum sp.]|nr:hypothetical protein [Noviherbaspirillum sp.]